ncbi:hypothetical protein KKA53_02155 [Candidatus Dependentiae bacterium]|nr:hypothetical protein [Candidatus Dependentiae bacterium]
MPKTKRVEQYSNTALQWGGKHITLIKGLLALLFGVALLYRSHRVFINFIVFCSGSALIYYGLVELKLRKITDFIDKMIAKLRK